ADPKRRVLVADDGSMSMRLTVPDPIIARAEVSARIELWNKLGQPVSAESLVVTVTDPKGVARGFSAAPRRNPGNFGFRYVFARDGEYRVRVFPPDSDTELRLTLHVSN